MVVDGRVTGCAGQVLSLAVGHVLTRLWVPEALRQAKINNVKQVRTTTAAHKEVIGLDITVNEVLSVHVLNAAHELLTDHHDAERGESTAAGVEEILETGSEEVGDEDVVVGLHAEPSHVGDTDTSLKNPVELGFIEKLRVLGADTLKLDSDIFPGGHVSTKVYITKGSAADLAAEAVLFADAPLHLFLLLAALLLLFLLLLSPSRRSQFSCRCF